MPVMKRPASAAAKPVGRPPKVAKAAKEPQAATAPKAKTLKAQAPKLDALAKRCLEVVKGLDEADAPEGCLRMLRAMLPSALRIYKDQRHAYEESVVSMAADMLTGAEANMAKIVADLAQGKVIAEEEVTAREEVIAQAEAEAQKKQAAAHAKRGELADVAMAYKKVKDTQQAKQAENAAAIRSSESLTSKKDKLLETQATYLRPLVEGLEDEAQARSLCDELLKQLTALGLDASVLAAVPGAATKAPAVRGPFDTMVLSQLDGELQKRLADIDAELRGSEASKAASAAAIQAAEAEFLEARAKQLESANAYKVAGAEHEQALSVLAAARKELRALETAQRKTVQEEFHASRRLQSFRDGCLATFLALRDHVAPPPAPEKEPEAPETAQVEEEDDEAAGAEAEAKVEAGAAEAVAA